MRCVVPNVGDFGSEFLILFENRYLFLCFVSIFLNDLKIEAAEIVLV